MPHNGASGVWVGFSVWVPRKATYSMHPSPRVEQLIWAANQIVVGRTRLVGAVGLIPFCLERVLTSLTIIRTPLPPAAANSVAWTAETPHTIA